MGSRLAMAWAGILVAFLTGCAAPKAGGDASSGVLPDPDWGAVDSSAFRSEEAFAPLDLPTPTQERLASGAPGPGYWQQRCDYAIDAELDAAAKVVRGRAVITYTNNSPQDLPFLWLHLEQNVYRPDSLGARSLGPDSGLGGVSSAFQGGFTIESMTAGGQPLKFAVYDTLARVDLPSPVAARGGQVQFEVAWSFPIAPNGSDRLGWEKVEQGTLFLIAQWYPAVAVFDNVNGWNTLPYLSIGEFYFDFGNFDVRLTVPRSHLVSATGLLQNAGEVLTPEQRERLSRAVQSPATTMIVSPEEVGTPGVRPPGDSPTLTWQYRAENVRSFAWASSEAFIWDAAGAQGLSKPVLAQSFYPKEAIKTWEKATDYLRFSIEHYSKKWFEYPYPVASNINGPVPGMEYPMIVFCAAREDAKDLFYVTTHEIGHNWFPMLVNTDERRHPWMDEGFNSFINVYAYREYFQESPAEWDSLAGWTRTPRHSMAVRPDFAWRGRVGWLAYSKPELMLLLLREQVLGPDRFDAAFREYIRRWAFKSPQPSDFFRTMENAAGVDLAWFWRGWIYGTGVLDQGIRRVVQPGEGSGGEKQSALVEVISPGTVVMPVRLRVTLDDGTVQAIALPVQIWSTTSAWTARVETGGKRIVRAEVDPDGKLPDINRADNVWPAGSEK